MTSSAQAPNRMQRIQARLQNDLNATMVEVIDDSHRHVGHEGARDGKGHYTVRIVAPCFAGLRPMARHQMVYRAVADMMQTDIHALSIVALAPDEAL